MNVSFANWSSYCRRWLNCAWWVRFDFSGALLLIARSTVVVTYEPNDFMKKDATGLKLGLAFGVLVSILIGIAWLGLSRMSRINADLNDIMNRHWAKVELARDAVFYSN